MYQRNRSTPLHKGYVDISQGVILQCINEGVPVPYTRVTSMYCMV